MAKNRIKYDCIFSLGEVCFCANYLRAMRLRKFSAPFDWVAGATFTERMNFLLNDFEDFFNKEDLVYHGKREYPEPCDIYYNQRTHIVFNHDFPLLKSFDEQFPKVKERYNHRINSLYKRINKSKKVLIVYMEQAETKSGISSDEELCALMEELNHKFPTTHIDLMYIRHNEEMPDDEYWQKRIDAHVITAECFDRTREERTTAIGNYHNVRQLFKNIRCKGNILSSSYYLIYKTCRNIRKMIYRHKIKNGEEYIRILGIKVWRQKIEEDTANK
jgi:hypothetical protein